MSDGCVTIQWADKNHIPYSGLAYMHSGCRIIGNITFEGQTVLAAIDGIEWEAPMYLPFEAYA